MLENSTQSYGWLSIALHWLIAVTTFVLFGLGYWMIDLNYDHKWSLIAPHYHQSVGLVLTLVSIAAILWRFWKIKPEPLGTKLEKRAARIVQTVITLSLLFIFLSGYLITTADGRGIAIFNWFILPGFGNFVENQEDVAGDLHQWLAYGLMTMVSLHTLAALKHHFVNKDNSLVRILKPAYSQNKEEQ